MVKDHHRMRAWDPELRRYIHDPYGAIASGKTGHLIFELCCGIKDKNGVLIYEGDILDLYGHIAVVSWSKEELSYTFSFTDERGQTTVYGDEIRSKYTEILGNIHKVADPEKET